MMRTASTAGLVVAAGLSAITYAGLPPEVARYAWTDSPLATARVIGQLDSPDADPACIEITAPATATVRIGFGVHDPTFSERLGNATAYPVGTDPEGDVPQDVEFSPDGASYFILHRASRNIVQFNATTFQAIRTFPLTGSVPVAMDITPDGSRLIVAYFTQDQIASIDVVTGAESVLATGDGPGTVDITPDGARAIVGCVMDSTLRVINLASFSEERSISTPGYTQIVSFGLESGVVDISYPSPISFLDSLRVVFVGRFNALVSIIDVTTGSRVDIPVSANPAGAAVAGSFIAVSHADANGITTIINRSPLAVNRVIQSPGGNTRANGPIVVNAAGTSAVIAFQNAARWLDLTTDTFGPSLATANLENLVLNASGTRAIGIGFSGAVIDMATGTLHGTPNNTVSCTRGAASPIADRAVLASWPTFADDQVIVETDTTPVQLFYGRTGSLPEGDVPRHAAVTPNGQTAVASNLYSRNLTIMNASTGAIQHYAPLDARPGEFTLTSDGTRGVGCNLDGTSVSVVNIAAGTTVAVPSVTRLAQVEIDPAGAFAYLAQVANGDGVRKLNLVTNSFIGGLTATGNMGGVGYAYSQSSQIALSPDATLLAVPGAFDDRLDIVNTSTMAVQQAFTGVGTFITRASWSPEGDEILVSDRDADAVLVFRRPAPAAPFSYMGSISVGDQPYDTLKLLSSSRAFVINFGSTVSVPASIGVLDTSTLTQIATVPLPYLPVGMALSPDGTRLSVLSIQEQTTIGAGNFTRVVDGEVTVIDTATLAIVQRVDTNQTGSMLASDATGEVLAAPGMSSEVLVILAPGCDGIDFNNDGLFPDTQDVDDFLSVFSGGPCSTDPMPGCNDIDFNNDGLFPDTLDADALLSVFSGGGCL